MVRCCRVMVGREDRRIGPICLVKSALRCLQRFLKVKKQYASVPIVNHGTFACSWFPAMRLSSLSALCTFTCASLCATTFGNSETEERNWMRCATSIRGSDRRTQQHEKCKLLRIKKRTLGLCGNHNGNSHKGELIQLGRKGEQESRVELA